MNMHVGNLSSDNSIKPIDQAHILRSEMLDAFANLESVVIKLLAKSEKPLADQKAPLGQRIEALKNLTLNPAPTKKYSATLTKICTELLPYLRIRSDVVHANLVFCEFDGVEAAKFCNTVDLAGPYPRVRLLTFTEFKAINKKVKQFTSQLQSILNPPTTQPKQKSDEVSAI